MHIATAPPEAGLYPELPKEMDEVGFRLQKISELQKQLEGEKEARAALYKKYRHAVNALAGADAVLLASTMSLGIGGVSLLSTVVAAPVAVGLEIAALCCGLASVGCKFGGRRLQTKAEKHDEIRVLAESKLNKTSDHISKALEDHAISDDEFRLILHEAGIFQDMKTQIRARAFHAHAAVKIDEAEKKHLILQGPRGSTRRACKSHGWEINLKFSRPPSPYTS